MEQDKYDEHLGNLIKQLPNSKYIFEVTKCCNYSTFVLVNKRATLLDLYKEVDYIYSQHMKPIYPVPNNVVYRIYLDDGHSHEHLH